MIYLATFYFPLTNWARKEPFLLKLIYTRSGTVCLLHRLMPTFLLLERLEFVLLTRVFGGSIK